MGTKIFYFSATGNSLQIARNIADELENCVIRSMTTCVPSKPVGGLSESIGFIFPVYFNGLPRLVNRFIEKLVISPDWCPCEAVEYGRNTIKRARYRNPYVTLEDIVVSCGGME